MKNATSNHSGNPQSATLRKPELYTASVMMPSRKIQTTTLPLLTEHARGSHLAIRKCVLRGLSRLWHRSNYRRLSRVTKVDWLARCHHDGRLRHIHWGWSWQVIMRLLLSCVHHLHALFKRQGLRRTTSQQKRERNQRFHDDSFVEIITARRTSSVQTGVTV